MKHPAVSTSRTIRVWWRSRADSRIVHRPFRATLFDKSSARNWLVPWHQDTALPLRERRDAPGWGPWSIKAGITYAHAPATTLSRVVALRLHFDDSREDNGPLRVLPGTHALGVLSEADTERLVREIPPVDCLVSSGGIVAMRPLIVHASSKAETDHPRRVLHIEYMLIRWRSATRLRHRHAACGDRRSYRRVDWRRLSPRCRAHDVDGWARRAAVLADTCACSSFNYAERARNRTRAEA